MKNTKLRYLINFIALVILFAAVTLMGQLGGGTMKLKITPSIWQCSYLIIMAASLNLDVYKRQGLYLWQGDITTLKCDAIVNAANSGMTGCYIPNHRCIDHAIHTYAGVELRLACEALMEKQGSPEPTGQAKITPAFNLPCRYVLHTVGPIIHGRVSRQDEKLLASCYRSCLELAAENGLESVALCCISAGEFRFPNEPAAEIAVRTVKEFLQKQTSVRKVIVNVFKDLDKAIYEKLLRAD